MRKNISNVFMDRQVNFLNELFLDLKDDCKVFDSGQERKAKDIAGRIRTLLKDGPNRSTISLLQQLNKKNITFKDSGIKYDVKRGFSYFDILTPISNSVIVISGVYMGLVYKKVIDKSNSLEFSFAPLFQRSELKPIIIEKPFSEWWAQIIYEDPFSGYKLTREKLIMSSAEQDGFSHFDPHLNDGYKKFLQSDSLEVQINGEKIKFSNNPAKNSIRQIGYEIIETLNDKLSDIIK